MSNSDDPYSASSPAVERPADSGDPKSSGSNAKWLRIGMGVVILAVLLRYVDLQLFSNTLASLSPGWFAAMLAVALLARWLRAWKWNVLLRAKEVHISTWQALRMSLIAHFTGSWTPGQIGGDAYRWYALRKFRKTQEVLSTLLLERYAGLCAVSLFVVLGLPFSLPYLTKVSPWLVPVLVSLVVLVLAVIPCMVSQRVLDLACRCVPWLRGTSVEQKLRSFYQTLVDFPIGTLVVFALTTVAEVLSYFFLNYLSSRAVGLEVSLVYFLIAMPVVHLLLRVPISAQSLGVQEGCFAYALALHGFQPAQGLAVSVVQRVLEWIVSIVPGGLLMMLTTEAPAQYRPEFQEAKAK